MNSGFIEEAVKSHNELRALHGCPKLVHSRDLSDFAQKWADHLAAAGKFAHSDAKLAGVKLGENIAMRWASDGADYNGDQASKQWYSEIEVHDFKNEPRTLASGHFTQVVWKGSKEVGFGKAKSSDGKCIVVGSYRPAGNMVGSFVANVPPRLDGKVPTKEELTKSKKPAPAAPFSASPLGKSSFFDGGSQSSRTSSSGGKRTFTRTVTRTGPDGKKETVTETFEDDDVPDDSRFQSLFKRDIAGFSAESLRDFGDFEKLKLDAGMGGKQSKGTAGPQGGDGTARAHDDFDAQCLQAHNDYRTKHSAKTLTYASDLTKHAQAWADKLVKDDKFAHSKCTLDSGEKIGENIAMKWTSDPSARYTGQQIVDQWYAEEPDYDYTGQGDVMKAGHFTQVVWKGCQEVGVGKAVDKKGKLLVVCNYRPPGNMMGKFVENVDRA